MESSHSRVRATEIDFEGGDRRHTLKSLTDSERRHRDLFELCPHCLAVHSHESIAYINQAGAELLGAESPDQLVGRSIWDFVPIASREKVRGEIRRVHATQEITSSMDQQLVRIDGCRVDIQCFSGPVLFDGSPAVHIAIYDIGDRRQQERELRQQEEVLSQALRMATLGELAADLSYEVAQPVQAITGLIDGYMHMAETDRPVQPDSELSHTFQQIRSAVNQAQAILQRLSGFVRKSVPKRERLRVKDLVTRAIELVESEIVRMSVDVTYDVEAELPAIWAERVLIQQVMQNLVINGLDAMHEVSADERRLLIGARRRSEQHLEIFVSDSGVGIPEEKLTTVFARFHSTKAEGTGVGLSICRTIVESHGGRIWITRNFDRGVTCHVDLPISGTPA